MIKILAFKIFILCSLGFSAFTQELPEDNERKEKNEKVEEEGRFLELASRMELKLGLIHYAERDDYRAIGALKRYRILDGSLESVFLSNLIIGQIYHRNQQSELSVLAFELALKGAPDRYSKTFTYLMANQESCVGLSFYFDCAERLNHMQSEDLDGPTRDLISYQKLYVDIVLRRPVNEKRSLEIVTPLLRKKAKALLKRDSAFHELKLKNPVLAGVLSGVLPGAGQLYNGRPWDALLALSFSAAFAGGAYYAYAEMDNIPLSVLSGILFLGFYAGNITNAVTDSQRINAKAYANFFEALKKNYWARIHFKIDNEKVEFGYRFDWPGPK